MHPYAINPDDRRQIIPIIVVIGTVVTFLIQEGLISGYLGERWWFSGLSILAVSSGLLYAYNKWIWALSIGPVRLSRVPDLSGHWTGEVRPSPDDDNQKVQSVNLTISQTWLNLSITLDTPESRSHSTSSFIDSSNEKQPKLIYTYVNIPTGSAAETMHRHPGTTILWFDDGKLQGNYYTGRGRGTHGELEVTLEEE